MQRPLKNPRFAICVRVLPESDLELHKVYRILPDDGALREGYLRIVDASGEDYLYPRNLFITFALPVAAQRALLESIKSSSAD
jgi:hypothetical protein